MKKLIALFALPLAMAFTLSLASCTDNADAPDDSKDKNNGDNPAQVADGNFKLSVSDITSGGAVVSVEPTDAAAGYVLLLTSTEELDDEYEGDIEACVADYVDTWAAYIEMYPDYYTWDDALYYGADDYDYDWLLTASTEYVVFVAGVADGRVATKAVSLTFTTPAVVPSQNVITFGPVSEHGTASVSVTVEEDPYVLFYVDKESYDSASSDDEVRDFVETYLISMEMLPYYMMTGDYDVDFGYELDADTDYVLVAFGYYGGATTKLYVSEPFTFTGLDRSGYSTLDGDYTFDTATYGEMCFYGDFYGLGLNSWTLSLYTDDESEGFTTELLAAEDKTEDVVGTYEVVAEMYQAGQALAGDLYWFYLLGTWWYYYDEATGDYGEAPADSGTITVAESDNGYTVEAVLTDPKGNTITVKYDGELVFVDGNAAEEEYSAAKLSSRRTVPHAKVAADRKAKPASDFGRAAVRKAPVKGVIAPSRAK